jgi:glycosyltransferase involved in cell wall biosynthesis
MTSTPIRRIFYAAANGDLIGSFEHWRAAAHIAKEVARTYSGELFSHCSRREVQLLAISPNDMEARVVAGNFDVRHIRTQPARGIWYHLGQLLRSLRVMWMILRFRPEVAIISDRLVYWWTLAPLRLFGIRLVVAMHVRLWLPEGAHAAPHVRVLMALDRWFLRHCADGLLAVSHVVARDLGDIPVPTEVFSPLYEPDAFAGLSPARWNDEPFRLLFMGRVEANKGVLNLVEALALVVPASKRRVHLDVIGDGGALALLRALVSRLGLEDQVTLHGQLTNQPLLELLSSSAAVIVPTRSDMGEGYNKVAAEAVLAGRPVIVSNKCPILADIQPAAIAVSADDIRGYADAILRLTEDRDLFAALAAGTRACQPRFFDTGRGYGAACERLFIRLGFASSPQGQQGPSHPRTAIR